MSLRIKEEIEKAIVSDYLEYYSTSDLAIKYNFHRVTIQRILKTYNIPLRKRTAAFHDIHFFEKYTKESCYWAGFIAADGNISMKEDSVNIHLASLDYSHLEKFAKIINYQGNLEKKEKDCRINVYSPTYKNDLINNFDITPQKTKTIFISPKIPKEFLSDYIRGYFDGDGCISQTNGYLHISFTSGSEVLLEQIKEYFYNEGIIIRGKNQKPLIYNDRQINYFCQNALNILDILYQNSTDNIRLDRKYEKYLYYKNSMKKDLTKIKI